MTVTQAVTIKKDQFMPAASRVIKQAFEDGGLDWFKSQRVPRISSKPDEKEQGKEENQRNNNKMDLVPNLLHAISILRMLRSANFLMSVSLIIYGFLYKLLTYPEDRVSRMATGYQFHSVLIDYGACSLLVFEIALSAKLFRVMLRYQKAMQFIRQRMIKTLDCKKYRDLNQGGPTGYPLLSNMESGITSLRQEMQELNRK